jgi:hypothetical protein
MEDAQQFDVEWQRHADTVLPGFGGAGGHGGASARHSRMPLLGPSSHFPAGRERRRSRQEPPHDSGFRHI